MLNLMSVEELSQVLPDELKFIIETCISILTITVAVIGLLSVITIAVNQKNQNKINEQEKKIKELNDLSEHLLQQFYVLMIRKNKDAIPDLTIVDKNSDYRSKNNIGYVHLEKSQELGFKIAMGSLKIGSKEYKDRTKHQNKAIDCFEDALKSAKKQLRKTGLASQQAQKIKRDIALIKVNLADVYDDLDNRKKAIKLCKEAIDYYDECDEAYNMLASVYLSDNNIQDANKCVERAIEIKDSNGFAHLTRAEIYLTEKCKDLKEILSEIERALEYGCPVWHYIDNAIYDYIKSDADWKKLHKQIIKFRDIRNIADIYLQTEHACIL